MDPLYTFYVGWFIVLLLITVLLRGIFSSYLKQDNGKLSLTEEFKSFQKSFILVYLIMMGADWLQGPYVYALYDYYGFTQEQIGKLFLVGFGSSMICGLIVGTMTDKYGRKFMCIVFGVLYSLSCLTKHSSDYKWLMFGRLLGGISTSILFSSFESWMIHEHHKNGYSEDWLGLTFAHCTSGNGIVAILSGVVASVAKDNFGPVAPFDASLLLLVIGTFVIYSQWKENYGDSSIQLSATLTHAWSRLSEDPKIFYLGLIQSCFEGGMYIFVFMWTPALEHASDSIPILHGWVFASFMICVLLGSTLFTVLMRMNIDVQMISQAVFAVSACTLLIPIRSKSLTVRLVSFFVFEVCCGLFWPCVGFMRSRYIPESVRATVMNFFRIPLNLIVVAVLGNIQKFSENSIFIICSICMWFALVCQVQMSHLTADDSKHSNEGEKQMEAATEYAQID